ncbi:hypothetical protein TIFTF001_008329 [Ficus carica]|uniref:Uncharacterized protein n=1 Tax=Ficus carica TaxID=3494 RepID=A0AA87ZSB9_FICCA|nr:hypothetical protein TIFTF001_008329 [Ficus carica]
MRGKLIQLKKILGRNSGLYESEMEKARQNWIRDRQSEENTGLDLRFVLNCQEKKRMRRIGENLSSRGKSWAAVVASPGRGELEWRGVDTKGNELQRDRIWGVACPGKLDAERGEGAGLRRHPGEDWLAVVEGLGHRRLGG